MIEVILHPYQSVYKIPFFCKITEIMIKLNSQNVFMVQANLDHYQTFQISLGIIEI